MKLPIPTSCNRPLTGGRRSGQRGFSLTEVMVAGVVGSVIITSVAGMNKISQKTIETASKQEQAEAAVNSDINIIRQKMGAYTWCAGQGSIEPNADRGRCRKDVSKRGQIEYYSPNHNTPDAAKNPTDRDKFKNACQDISSSRNTFLSSLITSINSQSLPSSLGVTRTVTINDVRAKRLQITYSGDTVNRSLLMTPTVAAWCP
jgi:prepilin-type N-terminal cleavage/methylation domain-containing protein